MKFNKLGNTGLNVSIICLGTMTWGAQNNQEEAFKLMDCALDQGVNFFDTAEQYSVPTTKESYGKTEKIIGNWFKERNIREKVILATKISGPGNPWIRGGNLQYTKEHITAALHDSLKRLNTDYIDLYQLHWPERHDNHFANLRYNYKEWNSFESILVVLKKFIDQGKIRYIGISNETVWGLCKFLEVSKSHGLPQIVSIQNRYNLLHRTFEVDLAKTSIQEKRLAGNSCHCYILSNKRYNFIYNYSFLCLHTFKRMFLAEIDYGSNTLLFTPGSKIIIRSSS